MFQRVAMMRILGQSKGRFEQSNARPTAAKPGSTVYVRGGTYCQRLIVKVSGDAEQGFITFRRVSPVNKRSSMAGA